MNGKRCSLRVRFTVDLTLLTVVSNDELAQKLAEGFDLEITAGKAFPDALCPSSSCEVETGALTVGVVGTCTIVIACIAGKELVALLVKDGYEALKAILKTVLDSIRDAEFKEPEDLTLEVGEEVEEENKTDKEHNEEE